MLEKHNKSLESDAHYVRAAQVQRYATERAKE